MKVTCDRAVLHEAIGTVSGAAASRSPRVENTCLRLSASVTSGGGQLVLTGTDTEISIRLAITQVDVKTPGEVLVPADRLRQIVSAEDGEATLTLEAVGDQFTIRGQDATFKVFCFPAENFPPVPDFKSMATTGAGGVARTVFTLPAGQLLAIVERTKFAAAKENSRYAMTGVLMRRKGKELECVATDGKRLAVSKATLVGAADKEGAEAQCIIPPKALNQFAKLVKDVEEPVHVAVTDTQILVSFGADRDRGRAVLASNVMEGQFPPYSEVIPKDKDLDKRVTFDRDAVASAVRRAAVLTNEESRGVRMKFNGKEKQLELNSRAPEAGEARVTCDVKSYDGDDLEITFNPMFITEALRVISDPEVILEMKSPQRPGLFRAGKDFLYVVMPVNPNS